MSLDGHEWCIVRVRSWARLLTEQTLPRAGFVSAYHPLSGASYGDDEDPFNSLFYVFEATGRLGRLEGTTRRTLLFGAGPFKWKLATDNRFSLVKRTHEKRAQPFVHIGEGLVPRGKRLLSITRLRAEGHKVEKVAGGLEETVPDRDRHLHDVHVDDVPFRPIYLRWVERPPRPPVGHRAGRDDGDDGEISFEQEQADARARLVTHGSRLYASRAVPFPTILEARGAYADHGEVRGWWRDIAREQHELGPRDGQGAELPPGPGDPRHGEDRHRGDPGDPNAPEGPGFASGG